MRAQTELDSLRDPGEFGFAVFVSFGEHVRDGGGDDSRVVLILLGCVREHVFNNFNR